VFAEYLFAEYPHAAARVFSGIGGEAVPLMLQTVSNRHPHHFSKDATLLLEGDKCNVVYCVLDGWIALSKALEDGQNQIIDFALPGDIVDPVAADGTTSSVTIEALTDASLAAISYGSWEIMISEWPELYHLAHLVEAARQARRDERILRLGKGTAEMRVAYALLEFCIRLAPACGSECHQFHIPLTQQQLGDYVGLSSVHVCRTMRRMVRNGILEMHDHMDIRILDAPSLARLAGVDIEELKREIVPTRM